MKPSKPPALATWLVEHMIPGGKNEALTGDLFEKFSQGRSVAWYWRQVMISILVAFMNEWHILSLAATLTAAWAYPLNFWNTPMTHTIPGLGTARPGLVSLIYATLSLTSYGL